MMRFAAFILRRAEWRHGRSRNETKYSDEYSQVDVAIDFHVSHSRKANILMLYFDATYKA